MIKQCLNCKEEFETKRKDTKCCSSTCRSQLSRSVATDNATDNSDIKVNSNTPQCKGCSTPVSPLICVCHKCVQNGVKHDEVCNCDEGIPADQQTIQDLKKLVTLMETENETSEQINVVLNSQKDFKELKGYYFIPVRFNKKFE